MSIQDAVDDNEILLFEEVSKDRLPEPLRSFNFEKNEQWEDPRKELRYDIFTASGSVLVFSDKQADTISNVALIPNPLHFMKLAGWASINEKMVFVFSFINSNKIFMGSVGDSFENPSFTILSFNLKPIENRWNKHSVPFVTILNNDLNERLIVSPTSCTESFNEIN